MKNLLILLLLSKLFSCRSQDPSKAFVNEAQSKKQVANFIVGGDIVKYENQEHSFESVGVVLTNQNIRCSTNLISSTEVFTAAHCFLSTHLKEDKRKQLVVRIFDDALPNIFSKISNNADKLRKIKNYARIDKEGKDRLKKAINSYLLEEVNFSTFKWGGTDHRNLTIKRRANYASFPKKFIDYIFKTIFKGYDFLDLYDQSISFSSIIDVVYIELERPVYDIEPTPEISEDELRSYVQLGEEAYIVGWGVKSDPKLLKALDTKLGQYLTFAERNKLEEKVTRIEHQQRNYNNQKSIATVKIDSVDHSSIVLTPIAKGDAVGACSGDSGGGAFIKLPSGEYRQLGITTGSARVYCGDSSYIAPIYLLEGSNFY